MYYPESPYCPNCEKNKRGNNGADTGNNGNGNSNMSQESLLKKIQEVEFAAYDVRLFLDTHPYDEQALDLFTQLSATAKSLVQDYENAYGPITAGASPNETPFAWVADDYAWPWVMKGDN